MVPIMMSMMVAMAAQGGAAAATAQPASTPAKGTVNVPAQAERPAETYPYRLVEPSAAALKERSPGGCRSWSSCTEAASAARTTRRS